jgi:hypothetical protein
MPPLNLVPIAMKLKHSTLQISEQNPFGFDKLDRKQHAEMLTQFILSIEEPLTISVEAES